jgi:hypothetical protein
VDIEIHHIIFKGPKATNEPDNGIPLCYDCHGKVQRYNEDYPMGSKYKPEELKERREQVYDEFTRHLAPPLHWEVTQNLPKEVTEKDPKRTKVELPKVRFNLSHKGNSLPVKVRVRLEFHLGNKMLPGKRSGHYSGKRAWNMNPRHTTQGNFVIPTQAINSHKKFRIVVNVSLHDAYGREHKFLPVGFVYMRKHNDWYFDP